MTATRYTARAHAARPHLLELLSTRPRWTDGELLTRLELQAPVLQELLSDLLAKGTIRRRFAPSVSDAVYSLNAPQIPEQALSLSPVQQRVQAFLLGRKETLGSIAAALHLPKEEVADALSELDDHDLLSCSFVGIWRSFPVHREDGL